MQRERDDPISVKKCDIIDLENNIERLQKELSSYTRSVTKDNETVQEVYPQYEVRAKEIANMITADKMRVAKIKICLDKIDKMFQTFPDGLKTWDDLMNQKQYLERKLRNPEHFVCYFDWSKREEISKFEAERKEKQAEIISQLSVVDGCIEKIRPLIFDPCI
ncbi:MAG: hypothetical protein ACE14P_03840 [Methanotrichaceae archaeon]